MMFGRPGGVSHRLDRILHDDIVSIVRKLRAGCQRLVALRQTRPESLGKNGRKTAEKRAENGRKRSRRSHHAVGHNLFGSGKVPAIRVRSNQSPACIYTAVERSINRRHVYRRQTPADTRTCRSYGVRRGRALRMPQQRQPRRDPDAK